MKKSRMIAALFVVSSSLFTASGSLRVYGKV